ncbi:MAG TPA: glycerophosphodiester phosphodiesterase [Calditerricola sp.]
MPPFLLYAHRGASRHAPENTLAAFRRAIADGANGLELDVQLSKDGVPIVLHDEWLGRTVRGRGWVRDHTWDELARLDAGAWFSPAYSGEPIPTLEDVCRLVADTALVLNVELKTQLVPQPGIEERITDLLRRYALLPRTVISSFSFATLQTVRRIAPDATIAVLYWGELHRPWRLAAALGAPYLHPPVAAVTPRYVQEAHRCGLRVVPYTVNSPAVAKRLVAWGVDGLITDDPGQIRRTIGPLHKANPAATRRARNRLIRNRRGKSDKRPPTDTPPATS